MKTRTVLLILSMCMGSSAFAGTPPPASKSSPTVAKTTTKRTSARAGSTRTAKPRQAVAPRVSSDAKASPAPGSNGKAPGREGPRTLQDIHIEGEIPVPQVLFITARDQRRFLDFHHHRYLKTSQQVGEQTVLPSWIGVTRQQPTDAGKENPR